MIKTFEDEKIKIKNKSMSKGRIAEGFRNGKLFRGKENSEKEKLNRIKLTPIKDYKGISSKQYSDKETENRIAIPKKFIIGGIVTILTIVAIIVSVVLFRVMTDKMSNINGETTQNGNNIRDKYLNEDVLSETDNVGELPDTVLANGTTDEKATENNVTSEDRTTDNTTTDNINTPVNNTNLNSEEAVFFYSNRQGSYGLVGFPLPDKVKSLSLKDKISFLAKELLKSPTNNAVTMIPEGTRFLGFRIVQKTLYLNFSDEFNYNNYGVEGDIQQVAQIVYTFTSLKGIDKVSFMINGNYPDSIGSHGLENKEWSEKEIASLL